MSTFYSEMADIASEVLDEFKQGEIVLLKPGTTTPGPNPWDPPVTTPPTSYPLSATAKGVSKEFIDGDTILATDLEITAAVFDAEPDPADTLTVDGQAVTVIKTMRIPAAGPVVAWKFIVRG